MSKLLNVRLLPCKCGGSPIVRGDQRMHMSWVECQRCGLRTGFYAVRRMAIDAWNRWQMKWRKEVPEPPEIPLEPIEGRKDCRHYVGFVGMRLDGDTTRGVMHCKHYEYLDAIIGVKNTIGGIPTDECARCRHYEPKEGATA